jgi:hypothetical protein
MSTRLTWIQRQTLDVIQVSGATFDSPFSPVSSDAGEIRAYSFQCLPSDYLKIFSAFQTGVELIYPEEAYNLRLIFERTLMSLCEQVRDCVTQSEEVQHAIQNIGNIPDTGALVVSLPSDENIMLGNDCTDANIYGFCVGVVELTFDSVANVLEAIDSATNAVELAIAFADNIPLIQALPIALFGEFSIWVREVLADNWSAFDTLAKRQQIACELYCIAKANCSLSYNQIASYFMAQTAISLIDNSIEQVIEQATVLIGVDETSYAMLALFFGALSVRQKFGALVGYPAYTTSLQWYTNDTNPDYIFCPSCVTGDCILPYTDNLINGLARDCTTWDAPLQVTTPYPDIPLGSNYALSRNTTVAPNTTIRSTVRVTFDNPQSVSSVTFSSRYAVNIDDDGTRQMAYEIKADGVLIVDTAIISAFSTWYRRTFAFAPVTASVIEISIKNGTAETSRYIQHRLGEILIE